MLAGLLAPTAGEATVAGWDVRADPAAVRARVGLVTDSPGLHDQMTPLAYLDFFGRVYGLDADTRRRRIAELLGLFAQEWGKAWFPQSETTPQLLHPVLSRMLHQN